MSIQAKIPFNRACFQGKELVYIARAIENAHISGDGEFTRLCHQILEAEVGAAKALLTTSCTHALEMAALLLDLREGDEVILPSYTFVSTANAFVLRGAKPVFIDIRPDTLNLDENLLPDLLTDRTRAVVPVHYAGVACEMDSILPVCEQRGVAVVEDNAHGLFGKYKGRPLGSFGALSAQSFHETKNFTCGEGGALLINDSSLIEQAEIIREKGTNRSRFFRGQVDKYTWVGKGSSYLPSELLAAFLYGQLEYRTRIQETRKLIWNDYFERLSDWAGENGVRLPTVPEHCEQAFHMFYLIVPSLGVRQRLITHLASQGVNSVFHYVPLHLSEMGRSYGGRPGQAPVTEDLSERLLRLPFYYELTESDRERVAKALASFEDWD